MPAWLNRLLAICLAVALGGIGCKRAPKAIDKGVTGDRSCYTVLSGAVTLCQGYRYSAYGLAAGTSGPVALAGEDPPAYDVYYLTASGPDVKGTTCFRTHGGGWGYATSNSPNLLRQIPGGEEFAQALLNGVAVPGRPPLRCAAVYDLMFPLTAMMTLSAPAPAGATTLQTENIGAGGWFWPTGAPPAYDVVLDQGKPNRETVTVTAQSLARTGHRMGTLTLASATAYAHDSVTVWLGEHGFDNPGAGGQPGGPYPIAFSGGDCATEPTGAYFIDAGGTLYMGGIAVTGNGSGCGSTPAAAFPAGGWSKPPNALVRFSTVNIAATEWPAQSNAVASFLSYHAHCSAGGASPGAGACASGAVRGNPLPGSPNDDRCIGDSAGAHLCVLAALSGAAYLSNAKGSAGYSEWTDTGWKVTGAAVWSLPADLNDMWRNATTRAGEWSIASLVGGYPPSAASLAAASPRSYAGKPAPRMEVINGSLDNLTFASQASAFCAGVPGVTCLIVPGQPHELDAWKYPGVTLGRILKFILQAPGATP